MTKVAPDNRGGIHAAWTSVGIRIDMEVRAACSVLDIPRSEKEACLEVAAVGAGLGCEGPFSLKRDMLFSSLVGISSSEL